MNHKQLQNDFFAYHDVIIPLILKNAYKKIPKIYQFINIFRMMFVYHYVIIPFHPQYLPRYAPLILQNGGCPGGGCPVPKPATFLYYYNMTKITNLINFGQKYTTNELNDPC